MSSLLDFTEKKGEWEGRFVTVECKKALSPSKLPGLDFALNPYGGCNHGCVYCYAPEVTHSPWNEWRVVKVKSNIADRLSRELRYVRGTVGIGTVTDPYQYAEARFMLTRSCLELLKRVDARISIITKSDLITRDIDLLSGMNCSVMVTMTTLDDRMSKITEPGAPLPAARLSAIRKLADSGINVSVLAEPMMSHIEGREEEFAEAAASSGAKHMELGGVNYRPELRARLERMNLRTCSPESLRKIKAAAERFGMSVSDPF